MSPEFQGKVTEKFVEKERRIDFVYEKKKNVKVTYVFKIVNQLSIKIILMFIKY